MSGIVLRPIDGGESITVPTDSQTVIGRGNFLQVLDKRVSRNHGMLEVVDGTLFLTPTHANPCFYQKKGTKDRLALPKDQQKRLEAGDMFGLLQDKFFYEVTYGTVQNGKVEQKELSTTEKDGKEVKKDSNKETTEKDTVKKEEKPPEKDVKKEVKDEEKKKDANKLNDTKPTEASKETSPEAAATKDNSNTAVKQEEKANPTSKEDTKKELSDAPNSKKRKLSEAADNTSETTTTETPEQKEKPQKANTRSGVDDFVIGDEYSDDDLRYRRRTYKEDDDDDENDEDFIAWDDDDSGSDWEKKRGTSRGRGKGRGSPKKLSLKPRGPGKSVGRKRRRRRNCDEDSDEELDSYIPRPSRRRAAARAQKEEEEGEEEEEEEEGEEEEVEEEEEEEDSSKKAGPEKKERVPCQYGDKCFRKNASHLKEFSHPCDEDVKGTEKDVSQTGGEEQERKERKNANKQEKPECQYGVACYRKTAQHRKEYKHTIQPEPVNRPKRMTTTLKVTGGDEDFSDQPPSDEESMDEDSEWEPEAASAGGPKVKGSAAQKKVNA
ncbi:aprataxin and PNK-like factor isoform X1 [Octopus vulgaris]|uniref:Aprataxin and PNK-like factor isoform X1 n=1 Tax=Octopus vulgaris TaxID=6645 RepID=A0AA36F2G7_OCTVU|nr:aprataxin and PNK-like factor isoform X1 [Octopus vulgaris]